MTEMTNNEHGPQTLGSIAAKSSQLLMRAAWFERKGHARDVLQIGELRVPDLRPGEALVSVRASGVNPSDTKVRGGLRGDYTMPFARIVPHQDGAGIVVAVGPGVSENRLGERVWLYEAQMGRAFGTAAQFVAIPSDQAIKMPQGMSFEEGACLGVPALTAHRCVFADGSVCGLTVLVTGGAGAVGFYAIQYAKRDGARVITTVSNRQQAATAWRAGADCVLDRNDPQLVKKAAQFAGSEDTRSVDRIIEVALGANLAASLQMLKPGGVIAAFSSDAVPEPVLPFWALIQRDATIRFVLVYAMSAEAHREAIDYINAAANEGWLLHHIGQVLPLERIVEAHELVEGGRSGGKVVLSIQ